MNKVKIAKVLGLVLTVGGTIVTSWVTGKENEKTLERLVNKKGE